jgi:hypothetical protein
MPPGRMASRRPCYRLAPIIHRLPTAKSGDDKEERTVRRFVVYCLATGVLVSLAPRTTWASTAGRRNTALAATALAVGAWSQGTGKAGRKNTAILATAGAAVAWSRYANKKRSDQARAARRRAAVLALRERRPYPAASPVAYEVHEVRCCEGHGRGRKVGHWIGKGHWKHGCKHHDDDDD